MRKLLLIISLLVVVAILIVIWSSNSSPKNQRVQTASLAGWSNHSYIPSTTTSTSTTTTTILQTITITTKYNKSKTKSAVVKSADNVDFMSCVRNKESSNNYAYNDGSYQGAYNMSPEHWGKRGGYATADKAPPEMQDQKFREDIAGGRDYMHQQYPKTSKECGLR